MLATLAIIVWHLYAVIFDPDAYPINFAWFDGRMSVEHYQHEHPLDTATLLAAEAEGGDDAEVSKEEPVESAK